MKNFMNDNMVMLVVGGEQTETLPGGDTSPSGGIKGISRLKYQYVG